MQFLEAILELFGALLEVIIRLIAPVIVKLFSASKTSWRYLMSGTFRRATHARWKRLSRLEVALEIVGHGVMWLLSVLVAGGLLLGMAWGLVEVLTEDAAQQDSEARMTQGLERYAESLLRTLELTNGEIGLEKKLFGDGLKDVKTTQEWAEQTRAEALWQSLRARTRTAMLKKLCHNMFGSPWFIQIGDAEPLPLFDWFEQHHPETPRILYADRLLDFIDSTDDGTLGLRSLLPGKGLTRIMPVKAWVADARIRALRITADAGSRAEVLDRLVYASLFAAWYVHFPDREPEPLINWLMANHPDTIDITGNWNRRHWVRRLAYAGYSVETLLLGLLWLLPVMLAGAIMALYKAIRRTTRYLNDMLFGYVEQTIVRDRAVTRDLLGIVPFSCLTVGIWALMGSVVWETAAQAQVSPRMLSMYLGGLSVAWLGLFGYSLYAFRARGRQAADAGWAAGIISGVLAGGIGGLLLSLLLGAVTHLLLGLLVGVLGGIAATALFFFTKWAVFRLVFPLGVVTRFTTILCENCFRATHPLRCRYERGIRYCEHCNRFVDYTRDPGRLIVAFGEMPEQPDGRVFVLANHDFEQNTQPMDISDVYLDTHHIDKRLLERFFTYIINHPPERGITSVTVSYHGALDDLGDHLKNTLRNTFSQIEQRRPPQP